MLSNSEGTTKRFTHKERRTKKLKVLKRKRWLLGNEEKE
jgi:hypothetical protein